MRMAAAVGADSGADPRAAEPDSRTGSRAGAAVRLPAPVVRAMVRLTLRPILSAGVPPRLQRRLLDAASAVLPLPRAVHQHRSVLGEVPVSCVRHGAVDPGRAVLYLHGGGFTTGSPRAYRTLAAALSRVTGATVYLLDYRLAPEHPYPAALTDTLAAFRALLAAGWPADRVVLAGDSAGGHLALAAALRLRDEGGALPAGLALISPWLELAGPAPAARSRDPLLQESWLRSCARAYRAGQPPTEPGLNPLAADLSGLPPLHVQAGADELLAGDADRLVERARAAGVPVGYDRWPGMWHNFQVFTGLLAAADQAVEALGRAIRPWWPAAATGPGRRRPSVAIVGAGFGGLGLAIELTKLGHRDFVVLDKADRVGGVWRENTYPGAACDVPSVQYCYSFEPRPDWPRRFSGQADILEYLQRCVARYRLADHLRLGTEVVAADFEPDPGPGPATGAAPGPTAPDPAAAPGGTATGSAAGSAAPAAAPAADPAAEPGGGPAADPVADSGGRWRLRTAGGDVLTADVLVFACGQLGRPSYPDIPGLDRFTGRVFHSACWEHDHDLTGRRVAVIGTGSSALQFVPRIAPVVGHLTVFQRTAGWVLPKLDGPYSARRQARQRRWPVTMTAARHGWDLFEEFLTYGLTRRPALLAPLRLASRALLRSQVHDPAVRARLTPAIEFGCKRIGFSLDWYPTFNRSTVDLVTAPIEAVTEAGVRTADGALTEVDTIILGTGFAATEFLAPIRVHGPGGRDLRAAWPDGARAYLGITVPGFPNMFLMYGPNTNLGSGSIVAMLEAQASYIGSAVDLLAAGRVRSLEVRADVAEADDRWTQARLGGTVWVSCRSWYRTAAGRITNNWPGQLRGYRRRAGRLELADYRAPAGEQATGEQATGGRASATRPTSAR